MADEIDVSKITDLNTAIELYNQAISSGSPITEELKLKVAELKLGMESLGSSTASTNEELENINKTIGLDLTKSSTNVATIMGQILPKGIDTAKDAVAGLARAAKNSAGLLAAMIPATKNLTSPLQQSTFITDQLTMGLGKRLTGAMKDYISVQNVARTAFVAFGESVEGAEGKIKGYAQTQRDMAAFTGLSMQEIQRFNKTVGRYMPEALIKGSDESKKTAQIIGVEGVTAATAAATAYRTFGFDVSKAASESKRAILEFNQTSSDTLRGLGNIRAAAEGVAESGLAHEQITRASSSLAIFGQKTDSAASMWRTFAQTLQSGGVPIQHVGKIVDNVTQGLAGMSTENRAFISMMGGMGQGKSALGGALKMELAMREPGGMNKIMGNLTRTLGRFAGGKIVTLKEAVDNPQLENIFMVQRSMLQKMGMGQSDEQRNRILEVMQKVNTGGMSQIDAQKAAEKVFNEGKAVAQAQVDPLQQMEKIAQASFSRLTSVDSKMDTLISVSEGGSGIRQQQEALAAGTPEGAERAAGLFGETIKNWGTKIGDLGGTRGELEGPRYGGGVGGSGTLEGPGMMERIAANMRLGVGSGGLGAVPPAVTKALSLSDAFQSQTTAQAREPGSIEMLKARTNRSSNDLKQLMSINREGFSTLKTGAGTPTTGTAQAGGPVGTFIIRLEGTAGSIKELMKKKLEEFKDEYDRGIIGDGTPR